jgi:predicted restriction endonuclease
MKITELESKPIAQFNPLVKNKNYTIGTISSNQHDIKEFPTYAIIDKLDNNKYQLKFETGTLSNIIGTRLSYSELKSKYKELQTIENQVKQKILKSRPIYMFLFSKLINERFPEAEKFIQTNKKYWQLYKEHFGIEE